MENEPERFDKSAIRRHFEEAHKKITELSAKRSSDLIKYNLSLDVKLLSVTKTVPVEIINYAIDELGVCAIGENRVQELLEKYDKLHQPKDSKLEIHLIGSLQTNKVKYIIDKVDMIESLDSVKLAAEIDRQAKKHGKTMDVLIEINIGKEEQKGGIFPEEIFNFLEEISAFDSLRVRGLMTIAPKCDKKENFLSFFEKTYRIFIDISEKTSHNIYGCLFAENGKHFDTLSMGMSDSFEAAVMCGSNEIRLGSALFGKRQYPTT